MKRRTLLFAFIVAVGSALIILLGQQPASRAASNSAPYLLYHPTFNNNIYSSNSTLQLDNLTDQTANITLTLYGTGAGAGTTYSSTRMIDANTALVIPDVSLSGVPNGFYAVNVESDQPLESLIYTQRLTSEDSRIIYRGQVPSAAIPLTETQHLFLGPFLGRYLGGGIFTVAAIFNPGSTTAIVYADFRNPNPNPPLMYGGNSQPSMKTFILYLVA